MPIKKKYEHCIIVFTKYRPKLLLETIQSVQNEGIDIIVLDDSLSQARKISLSEHFCKENIFYHGKLEQANMLRKLNYLSIEHFIAPLGAKDWNLGYVRNYAIILAKLIGYKKILFIDDDITVPHGIIHALLEKLDDQEFVGSEISGKPDYSIVDEITEKCGLKLDLIDTISGGFLGFNTANISHHFLNIYNEDLIWIYLYGFGAKRYSHGVVHQQNQVDPIDKIKLALVQEMGEVLLQGVVNVDRNDDCALLMRDDFWSEIIDKEIKHVHLLAKLSKTRSQDSNICESLLEYLKVLEPSKPADIFFNYFKRNKKWKMILARLDSEYSSSSQILTKLTMERQPQWN